METHYPKGLSTKTIYYSDSGLETARHRSKWGFASRYKRCNLANSMKARLQIKVSDPTQSADELSGGGQNQKVMGPALATNRKFLSLPHR